MSVAVRPATTTGVRMRDRVPIAAVLAVFGAMVVLLTAVVTLAASKASRTGGDLLNGPPWLDAWFQMDSGWYHEIAVNGYSFQPGQQSSVAFFPSYPVSVRLVGALVGDFQIAGTALAVLCGAASVALFTAWVWRRLPRVGAVTAVALLMLYPFAFYLYGAMYSESLFLLTAIGAFMLADRRRYWLAGLVGAIAAAGRPVGIAVVIGLALRMLELNSGVPRPGWRDLASSVRSVRWRQVGVLVAGLGLAAWCGYLWLAFGSPLAFLHVQSAAGWQGFGPRTWFKVSYLELFAGGHWGSALIFTAQAVVCLLFLLLLPRVGRLFGWGYGAFATIVVGVSALGSQNFGSTGRFLLVAFPVFAAAGSVLAAAHRRRLRAALLVLSGIGLVGATAVYGAGLLT